MARSKVPYSRYLAIRHEAEVVAQMTQTEGWKIIEDDLLRQASRIEELLAQNRLRTVTETITTGGTTKTFTTTAETQIAENAGMYKQIQQLFTTIQTIIEAPNKLTKLEQEGSLTVEKVDKDTPIPEVTPSPFKVPSVFVKIRKNISRILRERAVANEKK